MAPIDPHQLLKALAPLLSKDGAIKSAVEAKRIISLMRDANKLVCRCVYVNILKATDSVEVLEMLMESGMWDILNNWLQESTEGENTPFLAELLKVYKQLPVTVEIMKQNTAAKTIKQISKSKDDTLKVLASSIVDTWMQKIREKSSTDPSNNNDAKNLKKKKKLHKGDKSDNSKSSDSNKSESDSKEKRSHSNHVHHRHSRSSSDSVEMTDAKLETSNKGDKSESKTDASGDVKKRARTVKVQPQRFRSTGLEEPSLPPPKRKNTSDVPNKSSAAKRTSIEKPDKSSEPPEKKNRPLVNTTLASSLASSSLNSLTSTTTGTTTTTAITPPAMSPTEIHEKIKIIPPKPMPSSKHKVMDSSGFMDALISGPTSITFKRKKKPPTVTTNNKTPTSGAPATPTTPPTPLSPNTAMAQKLPSVPSFYKDTLETTEGDPETKSEEKDPSRSPSPTEDAEKTAEPATDDVNGSENSADPPKEDTASDKAEVNGETSDVSSSSGSLPFKRKKKKKSVTWAEEHRIRQIFYFELDETERENVNKPKDFNAMKKQEMMMDRRTIETAKRLSHDNMVEFMPWRRPIPVFGLAAMIAVTSTEKEIQAQREQGVLQALFFSKQMLPDTPAEPEMENVERTEPVVIPLDDEKSGGEEYHYTYDQVAQPPQEGTMDLTQLLAKTTGMPIPPDIAKLLSTIQHGGLSQPVVQDNPQLLATVQNFISSVMSKDNPDENTEQLRKLLEPLQAQFGMVGPMGMEGMPPMGGPHMGGPMGPPPPGLLGMAPPGFRPMGMRPPAPHGGPGPGPRPRFQGPPQGPSGHRPNMPYQDEWDENLRGGPPAGSIRPHGRPGFPVMRGRGGPPPRGRGNFQRGRGRGFNGTVCRHFARGDCMRGSNCGFYHPDPKKGPPL